MAANCRSTVLQTVCSTVDLHLATPRADLGGAEPARAPPKIAQVKIFWRGKLKNNDLGHILDPYY